MKSMKMLNMKKMKTMISAKSVMTVMMLMGSILAVAQSKTNDQRMEQDIEVAGGEAPAGAQVLEP